LDERRFVWNFIRLENEHTNNCGKYRAITAIPLPYEESAATNFDIDKHLAVSVPKKKISKHPVKAQSIDSALDSMHNPSSLSTSFHDLSSLSCEEIDIFDEDSNKYFVG
jgi:hypothetical protein